jgi:hypothetical protein
VRSQFGGFAGAFVEHFANWRHNNTRSVLVRYFPAPASFTHAARNGVSVKLRLQHCGDANCLFNGFGQGAFDLNLAVHFLPSVQWSDNVFHNNFVLLGSLASPAYFFRGTNVAGQNTDPASSPFAKKAASVSEGRVSDSIACRPWPVILVKNIVKESVCILGAAGAISRRTPTGKPVQKQHPFSAGKYQH